MTLQDYLKNIRSMSDEKANTIAAHFQKVSFPKGTLLIEEGKTSKYSYFLEAGIIRCYLIDREGLEVTLRFYSAPDFFNDFLSFFEQKPSGEYYELLTDCTLHTINYDKVQHCFHQIPEFREWGRMLLTLNYAHLNQRVMAFHKQTASERYLALKSSHPEIIQNVPLTIIASYLGITKFSLSRIRKEFG